LTDLEKLSNKNEVCMRGIERKREGKREAERESVYRLPLDLPSMFDFQERGFKLEVCVEDRERRGRESECVCVCERERERKREREGRERGEKDKRKRREREREREIVHYILMSPLFSIFTNVASQKRCV